jgi:uncharacterized protein
MKKYLVFSFLLILLFFQSLAQEIPPQPNPPRLVNDFANQLNPTEVAQLERKLVAYNDSTSSDIVIVVVPTTGDYAIADYALKIGRDWKLGQKGKNNGIVLLWASTDRKIFISVGDGMEGVIPDAIAKRIITQTITPDFKNGMFYRGLDRGIDDIFKYATGEYKAEPRGQNDEEGFPSLLIVLVIFIVILFIIYKNRNNGGGRSGGMRNMGGPIFWPYTTYSGGGGSSGNWGGGGSWGGGGGSFGGFGGGGGFSGGGAGGDY